MNIGYDEIEEKKMKTNKIKKIIIVSIIILSVLAVLLVALIVYKEENPTYITTYIDDVKVQDFDKIIDIQTDENGKIQFYIPIRKFSAYLNKVNTDFKYEDFDGEYDIKTENPDSCHIFREGKEVSVYTKGSKIIYKKNLQTRNSEYEEYTIDKDVFMNNGILYASKDGIEKGYNVVIKYNQDKKTIIINTLDYLAKQQVESLKKEKHGNYGILEYQSNVLNNNKSIFEDVLIVRSNNGQYGLLSGNHKTLILEPKYDKINYFPDSKTFSVESNGKIGLFDKEGKQKIGLIYDSIVSMGKNSNLYIVKSNNQYGVVDANKSESDNTIIYPQYDQIGIEIGSFAYNGVKNGYIILDELIPVKQGKLWALYNKEGKQISDGFKYTNIGCSRVKSGNNINAVLQIPEVNVIAVSDQSNKYGFMDINGNDNIVAFVLDQVYIKTLNGQDSYWMSIISNGEEIERNVFDYLTPKK
ncbi:MAG TPA: hypothetical protein DEP51_02105 [Clostridiales bacterium]|nr:hypothetical protein [Clostridiales bacterium]